MYTHIKADQIDSKNQLSAMVYPPVTGAQKLLLFHQTSNDALPSFTRDLVVENFYICDQTIYFENSEKQHMGIDLDVVDDIQISKLQSDREDLLPTHVYVRIDIISAEEVNKKEYRKIFIGLYVLIKREDFQAFIDEFKDTKVVRNFILNSIL